MIIFGLSIAVLFVCYRCRVPTIVGFLVTGVLAGPHGLGLIDAVREVEILAEVGVVLLLFTIGMLLDVGFVFQRAGLIALITLCVLALKSATAGFSTVLLGFLLRTTMLVGLALCQVGEFSFILSKTGLEYGLLSGNTYQLFLAVSVLTMASTPFIVIQSPRTADLALRIPLQQRLTSGLYPVLGVSTPGKKIRLKDHLIIVGFGLNGRNVARSAKAAGIAPVLGGKFADFFADRQLSLMFKWRSPARELTFQTLNFQHLDFFFLSAFLIGLYCIHRLTRVKEIGEVEEEIVVSELITQVRRDMRNLSTVGGLRQMVTFPISVVYFPFSILNRLKQRKNTVQ